MSDMPNFPYDIPWSEREVASVANLRRVNAETFLALVPKVPVRPTVEHTLWHTRTKC